MRWLNRPPHRSPVKSSVQKLDRPIEDMSKSSIALQVDRTKQLAPKVDRPKGNFTRCTIAHRV
ncbi:MAG: hypothetical protein EAZ73_07230 [Oscillatoriales cyanobacterium]|uniref:hypothetical protein n=1 Tax=unclassified Microcoleus TaxID=2642155 RepID=UPI001DF6396D|nr:MULTISPECIES: hypothetical protein [unclassified Microcoleus]TAE85136.1 MAG: hypothetical protein EAZ83_03665 [Oscillatoriales cyanobacterium]TAF21999.1 MAG: hypothetical protein EAZ73_07230 [Oscillatoriales cyanobacterium]TAF24774.1 MAG: hypothetical protein EAZ69_30460 [Oscillatoriales cyanobacterium]